MPLCIVIFVSGCKMLFEDYKRKKSDKEENNKISECLNNHIKKFERVKWKNIKVGNIVKIYKNEEFPSDLILLKSSNENGVCYIETKNLDGENNLKIKKIDLGFLDKDKDKENYMDKEKDKDIYNLEGSILCEDPDCNIYSFKASMNLNYFDKKIKELSSKLI
jgi:magnesium-transporting ATPase (P-type)